MRRLVISVHGIRTHGLWQERLGRLLANSAPNIEVEAFKFSRLESIALLMPFLSRSIIRRFYETLLQHLNSKKYERIDIVGHSFGTHVIASALERLAEGVLPARPLVHTVILSGSILKPNFPWLSVKRNVVERVVNDCGTRDRVLLLPTWFVWGAGNAGQYGFKGSLPNQRIINRLHPFGHSAYFGRKPRHLDWFMKRYWISLLVNDRVVFPPDVAKSKLRAMVEWVEVHLAQPAKFCFYVTLLLMLLVPPYQWLKERAAHREARLQGLADKWSSKALDEIGQGNLGAETIRLAVAAAQLRPTAQAHKALLSSTSNRMPPVRSFDVPGATSIGGVVVSADGRRLALTASVERQTGPREVDTSTQIFDTATGNLIASRLQTGVQQGPCNSRGHFDLAFSPSGQRLLSTTVGGTCLWDLAVPDKPVELENVGHAAFSPDEKFLVTARDFVEWQEGGWGLSYLDVSVTDLRQATLVYQFRLRGRADGLDVSSGGMTVVAGSGRGALVSRLDGSTSDHHCSQSNDHAAATVVRFNPFNENIILLGSRDGVLCAIDVDLRREVWSVALEGEIKSVVPSSDGIYVAFQSTAGVFGVAEAKSGRLNFMRREAGYAQGIGFAGSGNELVVTGNRGSAINIWSSASGVVVAKLPRDDKHDAFYAGGVSVSASDGNNTVLLWQVDRRASSWLVDLGEEIKQIQPSFAGNGLVVSGSRRIMLWNGLKRSEASNMLLSSVAEAASDRDDRFERVVASRDGSTMAASTASGKLFIRRLGRTEGDLTIRLPNLYRASLISRADGELYVESRMWPGESAILFEGCSGPKPVNILGDNGWRLAGTVDQICPLSSFEDMSWSDVMSNDPWRNNFALSVDGRLIAVPMADGVVVVDVLSGKFLRRVSQGYFATKGRTGQEHEQLESATSVFVDFASNGDIIAIASPALNFFNVYPAAVRRWDGSSSASDAAASRTLNGVRPVSLPGDEGLFYVFNDATGLLTAINSRTFEDAFASVESRVVDLVLPMATNDGSVAVVLHDHPKVISIGYGALDVKYHVEIRSRDLSKILSRFVIDAPITALAFSPEESVFAVGEASGAVHLINRFSGPLTSWSETNMPVRFLGFLNSGRELAVSVAPANTVGGLLGTRQVRILSWRLDELIRAACGLLPRVEDRDFSDYRAAVSASSPGADAVSIGCDHTAVAAPRGMVVEP